MLETIATLEQNLRAKRSKVSSISSIHVSYYSESQVLGMWAKLAA
jgi:hypothetical protein